MSYQFTFDPVQTGTLQLYSVNAACGNVCEAEKTYYIVQPLSGDSDGDGVSDECEDQLGTDPANPNDPADPNLDSDDDGLTDIQECEYGTNQYYFDTDGDGLADECEFLWGLDPLDGDTNGDGVSDSAEDPDDDGLTNMFECVYGTDPFTPDVSGDADDDGIPDQCELTLGTGLNDPDDPSDPGLDTDNDGLSDVHEQCVYGTNPTYYDSDADGLPDGWEAQSGLNPLDNDTDNDGQLDWAEDGDGDSLNNIDEWLYGTDPNEADTDGDGVSDGQEAAQGSNPNDSSDGGQINPEDVIDITLAIGDPSGSESERWLMRVGFTGAAAPGYGTVIQVDRKLPRGETYEITVKHLGTNCPGGGPNHDYTANVEVAGGGLVEDPDNLLTTLICCGCDQGDPDTTLGKVAYLHATKVDLDIDSDNNNGVSTPMGSDAEEDCEETAPGKFIAINDDDDNGNGVPDMYEADATADEDDLVPLRLSSAIIVPGSQWRMLFPAGVVRLWEQPDRTGSFTSVGEWHDLPMPDTLYAEGIAASALGGDVSIELAVRLAPAELPTTDTVIATVVGLWAVGLNPSIQVNENGVALDAMGNPDGSMDANTVIAADEALNVSNYVPNAAWGSDLYNAGGPDGDAFRIEVQNAARDGQINVDVEVVRNELVEDDVTKTLSWNKPGSPASARSKRIRLVTDTVDDVGPGTLIARLGDLVRLRYEPRYRDANNQWITASPITRVLPVGRPANEENNDNPNQRKHDIRELKLRIHVFNDQNGTPFISQQAIDEDIRVLNERMAQATIRATVVGPTNYLNLPNDGSLDNGLNVSPRPFQGFNPGELYIVNANAVDSVLDVFYIEGVFDGEEAKKAVAYIKSINQTNIPSGHNLIVMNTDGTDTSPFTLGHEVMHILLDSGHRDQPPSPIDPDTSLFKGPPSDQNQVGSTKRIGPNSDTTPAGIAGDVDTFTIRNVAETLP